MNRKAFTLIEYVMVIAIAGIIAASFAAFIPAALNSWIFTKTERDLLSSGRLAMNRMVREIRQISDTGSVNTFTGTEFEFVDQNDVTINYQQSGGSLNRNSDELTGRLQDPGGLTFTYLDSSKNVAAVSTDIRMVRIRLILASGDNTIVIQSLSRLRNIN